MNVKKKLIVFILISITSITINNYISEIQAKTKTLNIEIQNIEAYWDKECSIRVTKINWDKVEPGETKNILIYLKNVCDKNIFPKLEITNWNPTIASKYIVIDSNFSCKKINNNLLSIDSKRLNKIKHQRLFVVINYPCVRIRHMDRGQIGYRPFQQESIVFHNSS